MPAYLGLAGVGKERSGRELLLDLPARTWTAQDSMESGLLFFTMLPSMAQYRRLVDLLGPTAATQTLLAINDLVAIGEFQPSAEVRALAVKSEVFSLSFMRSADSYFALKNAGPLLRGLANEKISSVSKTLAIKFQLPGRATEHDLKFEFDFDADLPKRIAIVIGKNGVGKSQSLSRIARAALTGSRELTNGEENGTPEFNRLIAFAPTNESESVFPSEKRKDPQVWYRRYSLNRSSRAGRGDHVADLIAQLARSEERIALETRWSIFIRAIKTISEHDQLRLIGTRPLESFITLPSLVIGGEQERLERFAAIDTRKDPVRVIKGKAYPLSSGEISFLKFAVQASLSIENGSLLLLDEPETHLHPAFISGFSSLLDKLLELTGSIAIVATHSAYFVREVFQRQVTVLTVDENHVVHTQRPRLRTFGADVGEISYFVFGEDQQSPMAKRLRKKLLDRKVTWDQLYEEYKDELSPEMLGWLREGVEGEDQDEQA